MILWRKGDFSMPFEIFFCYLGGGGGRGGGMVQLYFWNLRTFFDIQFKNTSNLILLSIKAQTYLQPKYGNGAFSNVYLSTGQH
jgi:hypothetical protein